MSKRLVGSIVLSVGAILGLVGVGSCLEKIPAGYVGVVYSLNGGVTGEILGQGMHLISPIEHVAEYPVSTETMYLSRDEKQGGKDDDSFNISTKDGKPVSVDVELSYRYDADKADEVYTKWRGKNPREIENTYIRARVKSVANEITSQYAVTDVYGEKRTELNRKVFDALSEELAKNNIILETFTFTDVRPDDDTKLAIQAKVDAQQKLEQQRIEAESASVEAERRKVEEQGIAEAKRIKAQANADSLLIEAEAEAKANRLISESLNDKLLKLKEIEQWDGKKSLVQGSSTPIVNLGE